MLPEEAGKAADAGGGLPALAPVPNGGAQNQGGAATDLPIFSPGPRGAGHVGRPHVHAGGWLNPDTARAATERAATCASRAAAPLLAVRHANADRGATRTAPTSACAVYPTALIRSSYKCAMTKASCCKSNGSPFAPSWATRADS